MNPRDFCSEEGYADTLILSYEFDPLFFERVVLRDLWQGGAGDILVLADASRIAESTEQWAGQTRYLGRRYRLGRISVGGAFHPKVLLRLGRDGGLAWIGSGNVTYGGWGGNKELAAAWRVGPSEEDSGSWIRTLLDDLLNLSPHGATTEALQRLREKSWIRDAAVVGRTDVDVVTVLRGDSLIERLGERWKGRRFDRVLMYSGSTDPKGSLLREFHVRFGVSEAILIGTPGRIQFEPQAIKRLPLRVSVKSLDEWPPVHAKFYWFDGPAGPGAVFGSANCSAAAWLLGPNKGNAEAVVVYDHPSSEEFAPLLESFEFSHLEEVDLRDLVREPEPKPAKEPRYRLHGVEWEPSDGSIQVSMHSPTVEGATLLLDDGTVQRPLRRIGPGAWTAAWAPEIAPASTIFVTLTLHLPDGSDYQCVAWIDDLAELRHASRGRSIAAALASLRNALEPSEQKRIVSELMKISQALLSEPDAFPDPRSKPTEDPELPGKDEDSVPADPAILIRSLRDCVSDPARAVRPGARTPLTLIGVLRALFPSEIEESDGGEGPPNGEADEQDESDRSTSRRVVRFEPEQRYRKRLRRQMDTFLDRLGNDALAENATAMQLVQASAYPLAVATLGRIGGWLEPGVAHDWTKRVFDTLFTREGEAGARGLLEEVRLRYVRQGNIESFMRTVGDGTLWIALLIALSKLSWAEGNGPLNKALALREVYDNRHLIASGEVGKLQGLVARMEVSDAHHLVQEAPIMIEKVEALEAYLIENESSLRTVLDDPLRVHQSGDPLWRKEAGWAECLKNAKGQGVIDVYLRLRAAQTKVQASMYINLRRAASADPHVATLLSDILHAKQ